VERYVGEDGYGKLYLHELGLVRLKFRRTYLSHSFIKSMLLLCLAILRKWKSGG